MDPVERYNQFTEQIGRSLSNNSFDNAYRLLYQYIDTPDKGENETRKQQMIEYVKSIEMLDKDPKIQRLLTGGNRRTKRTKRTTNRKMRKSLIRRRR
jgi:hypothetical protein